MSNARKAGTVTPLPSKRTTPKGTGAKPEPPVPTAEVLQAPTDEQWLEEAEAQQVRELMAQLKNARATMMKANFYVQKLKEQIMSLGALPVEMPQAPPPGGMMGVPQAVDAVQDSPSEPDDDGAASGGA